MTTIDFDRVTSFAGQLLGDLGASVTGALIHLGDRLGLYKALAEGGSMSCEQLAAATGTHERYVREWLANQCASGYIDYSPETATYVLPPEHAAVLADEASPAFMIGGFSTAVGVYQILEQLEGAFQSGEGIGWGEHDNRMFCGVERFFGPAYRANLANDWIKSLDGVADKLQSGAKVADVGCGHGATAILMAQAYPNAHIYGFDVHEPSIEIARQRAEAAGVADRVTFACCSAEDYPTEGYDLVAFFDCLHDMGDPAGAVRHAKAALHPEGTLMLVEPMAKDRLEDNLNPVGRTYYGFSTMICTPASLSQPGRCGLGAQAGEARLREVLDASGFATVRRATETPFNMILEARP